MSVGGVGVGDFQGMCSQTHPRELPTGIAQVDQNSCARRRGVWELRPGLADSGLVDETADVLAIGHFQGEQADYVIMANEEGDLLGAVIPTPAWGT